MTDEQRQRYERGKEEAQSVYQRLMMESNAAVIQAKAPVAPATSKPFIRRVLDAITRAPQEKQA